MLIKSVIKTETHVNVALYFPYTDSFNYRTEAGIRGIFPEALYAPNKEVSGFTQDMRELNDSIVTAWPSFTRHSKWFI